jgi:putative transposase
VLLTDYGPEFIGEVFPTSCADRGILIDYIEPGKPSQNAYLERFNRSCRTKVLDTWLFQNLDVVGEMAGAWMLDYNEECGHDSLGGTAPIEVIEKAGCATFELSTQRGNLRSDPRPDASVHR